MLVSGRCLCGGVQYEIDGKVSDIGQCHCSRCRKSTGTAHATTLLTAAKSFCWVSGDALVQTYAIESGYDTAFCGRCGSPVPKDRGKVYAVPAGSLDGDPGVKPVFHAFVGSKAPWYEISGNLPQHQEHPPQK